MAPVAADSRGFIHTKSRRLRNCAASPTAPLQLESGEAVVSDGVETQDGNTVLVEEEKQVLVDGDETRFSALEGETQVVYEFEDGLDKCVGNVAGETQVWDGYGGDTQVDDPEFGFETQLMDLGGETEVQDDDAECVRNVCSQFLENCIGRVETSVDGGSVESTDEKDANWELRNNFVKEKNSSVTGTPEDHMKFGGCNNADATPPCNVEAVPGSLQRNFTSIRAASLRASDLDSRYKALVETENGSCQQPVEKENETPFTVQVSRSIEKHNDNAVGEPEMTNDGSLCHDACSTVRKLFNEDLRAESGIPTNEKSNDEEVTEIPQLPLRGFDEQVAGLSYIDSQEPGPFTQDAALDFVERFVNNNVSDVQLDLRPKREISKLVSCLKSVPKKPTIFRQPLDQGVSFDWDEDHEDEGGGDFFCRFKEQIFKKESHGQKSLPQPKKSRRCGLDLLEDKKKFREKGSVVHTDSKLKSYDSYASNQVLVATEAKFRRNLEKELNGEWHTQTPTETVTHRNDIQEMFTVGPDTQVAAEAMEALFCGELKSGDVAEAGQGKSAPVTDGKERLSTAILDLKKKSGYSDTGLGSRKNMGKHTEKKERIHERVRKRNEVDEVNVLPVTEKKRRVNDTVEVSIIPRRATRSMVSKEDSVTKIIPGGPNGVVIPKGKRTSKRVSTKDKSSKSGRHPSSDLHFDQRLVQEASVSRSIEKKSDAVSSPGRRSTKRDLTRQNVKSGDKAKQISSECDAKGLRNSSCITSKRVETSLAGATCSHDAADINREVLNNEFQDHQSAMRSEAAEGNHGVPTKLVSVHPAMDVSSKRRQQPAESACITPENHLKIINDALPTSVGSGYRRQLQTNLSRSSLKKEISSLLSNSPKSLSPSGNSRKRRDMNNVRVLFSQHLDDDVIKHQRKILARLGGSSAFSISDATHFVADSFLRTKNMLEAMALGKPVVTRLWLEGCNQTSCLIDERAYILRDEKKERELGFSMPDTLVSACQYPLLQNRKVIVTPNAKPSKDIIAALIKAVHGQVVEKADLCSLKVDKNPDNLLILSSEQDCTFCQPFLRKGRAVYSSELLLCGIVTQKLDYERHRLFENHVRREVTTRSRSTKR